MRGRLVITLLLGSLSLGIHAAVDPIYKDCLQRGYSVSGDSCLFPDGSACLLEDFNTQKCGNAFYEIDFCVNEGEYVWDHDACCDELIPWLPLGVSGQTICRSKAYIRNQWISKNFWWLSISFLIVSVMIWLMLKGRNRNTHVTK